MIDWIKSTDDLIEYESCVRDLLAHDLVLSMQEYIQHGDINCLEHSLHVSYNSYLACKRYNFDYRSAARAGLLHDFFLYDWHQPRDAKGLHGFTHPHTALANATQHFSLSDLEKDIIVKHMWPLTIKPPRYKEAYIVSFVDKYCATLETLQYRKKQDLYLFHNQIYKLADIT